jgi:diguanylate cyclase (GGDEF)-like protein/PAS domain S-box-containing protein
MKGNADEKAMLKTAPIPMFAIDRGHQVVLWNESMENLTGVSAKAVLGTNRHQQILYGKGRPCMADMLVDNDNDPIPALGKWYEGMFSKAAFPDGAFAATHFFAARDGKTAHWYRFIASPLTDLSGSIVGAIECCEDVTEQRAAEDALRLSEARYRTLVESCADGVLLLGPDRRIVSCNQCFLDMFGFRTESDVIGQSTRLIHSSDEAFAEYADATYPAVQHGGNRQTAWDLRHKDGRTVPAEMNTAAVLARDGSVTNFVVIIRDISDRKKQQERLAFMAMHDPLTGLPNRVLFIDRLLVALQHAHRGGKSVAVMFIDLDGFKKVNDVHGHDTGDKLLQAVGGQLTQLLRKGDTVARFGGDEFAVMLPELVRREDVEAVAQNLVEGFRHPFPIGQRELRVSVSVGIAVYPQDAETAEALLRKADAAMYRVKGAGRNDYQFYASDGPLSSKTP